MAAHAQYSDAHLLLDSCQSVQILALERNSPYLELVYRHPGALPLANPSVAPDSEGRPPPLHPQAYTDRGQPYYSAFLGWVRHMVLQGGNNMVLEKDRPLPSDSGNRARSVSGGLKTENAVVTHVQPRRIEASAAGAEYNSPDFPWPLMKAGHIGACEAAGASCEKSSQGYSLAEIPMNTESSDTGLGEDRWPRGPCYIVPVALAAIIPR